MIEPSEARAPWPVRLRSALRDPASHREWTVDANDGIIATAGLLEGFASAGATDGALIAAATAATVAGMLSLGGAKWGEVDAEREAQLRAAAEERAELELDPDREIAELARYYEDKGLTPELARQVAEQLNEVDPLAAQLESEHGITEVMSRGAPVFAGAMAAITYALGALVPLLITIFVPVAIETWLIVFAVIVSLTATSIISARTGKITVWRMLARTLTVGVGTLAISYLVGSLVF